MPRKLLVLTVQGGQPTPTYGLVNDISDSGAGIVADRLHPPGRDVRLRICFYPQVCLDTEARVVWGRDGLDSNRGVQGLALNGVQFAGPLDLKRLGSNETLGVDRHSDFDSAMAAILEYLEYQIPNYPFNHGLDRAFVSELMADFPQLDILEEVKTFRWYYDNDPVSRVANARAALRRWVASSTATGRAGESLAGSGQGNGKLLIVRKRNGQAEPGDLDQNFRSWVSFLKT